MYRCVFWLLILTLVILKWSRLFELQQETIDRGRRLCCLENNGRKKCIKIGQGWIKFDVEIVVLQIQIKSLFVFQLFQNIVEIGFHF